MNKAWAPWLLDSLHHEKYGEIRKASKAYIIVFIVLVVGMLLLVPEIIMILGGKKYAGAIYCLPPLMTSCAVQFIYTMYVNIEFYKKKTVGVSLATMAATAINILLNFIFIPMDPAHGYVIAAYTTLTGYVILLILHYIMVRRLGLDHVYDISYIVKVLGSLLVVSGLMNLLYSRTILRYALVLVYGAVLLYVGYKNKDRILHLLRKKEADPVAKTS
jgi:O-antigen/teichoic acid export membrane protein